MAYKIKNSLWEEEISQKKGDRRFYTFIFVVLALFFAQFYLNAFVYINVQVDGPSMMDTVVDGDVLIANKNLAPDYGDVVIIDGVLSNGEWLIKRVVGKGGDVISLNGDGAVYRNGVRLDEKYSKGKTFCERREISWVVPDGEIFYLGDNRERSSDSRVFGTCKESQIIGVVEQWVIDAKWFFNGYYRVVGKIQGIFGL